MKHINNVWYLVHCSGKSITHTVSILDMQAKIMDQLINNSLTDTANCVLLPHKKSV